MSMTDQSITFMIQLDLLIREAHLRCLATAKMFATDSVKDALTLTCSRNSVQAVKCLAAARTNLTKGITISIGTDNEVEPVVLSRGIHAFRDPTTILGIIAEDEGLTPETMQWIYLAQSELRPFHRARNKGNDLAHVRQILQGLERHLSRCEFLSGKAMTLSDIAVAADVWPFYQHRKLWPDSRSFPWLTRWWLKITSLPAFLDAIQLIFPGKATSVARGLSETRKLKVLCLHGYRQSGKNFRDKLGAFRKICGKFVEFVFVTAPHKVPSGDDDEESFGWWFSNAGQRSFEAHERGDSDFGFQESVGFIWQKLKEGSFDGVLAFSQGSALLVILCVILQSQEPSDRPKVSIPTLHVIGDTDRVIERKMSDSVLQFFHDPVVVRHPGGHFIPTSGHVKKAFLEFFARFR